MLTLAGLCTSDRPATEPALERRLILLLCGTDELRRSRLAEVGAVLPGSSVDRLLTILERLGLVVLVGQRLRALDVVLDPVLERAIDSWTTTARRRGRMHELATLGVLHGLEQAGIRALPLKGSILARQLYDDVGARSAGDIDILVAADALAPATAAVEEMGWRSERPLGAGSQLPVLHHTLIHPTLPRVELHWRVHWYETQFADDALSRAERPAADQPLRMQPADGLAALMLFYARDGFSGLRMAADVMAWWEAMCARDDVDRLIAGVVHAYPALAGPLVVGARLLASFAGLPARPGPQPFRWRVAGELASPFADDGAAQLSANASLVDLLLAPHRGSRDSLRREGRKVPEHLDRALTIEDELRLHLARWEHLLRLIRRWAIAILPAAARASRAPAPADVRAASVR